MAKQKVKTGASSAKRQAHVQKYRAQAAQVLKAQGRVIGF
jgi:hypothetical protein